ncbi:hypothetical protein [Teredinibacter turnerae]|uniref:hypothetical protein n=1 Tax=Teredinibacter turnerae TaxID=2426 RepID=UPI0030D113D9
MSTVFVLVNQDHLLLERSGKWGYGNDLRALYRTPYRDEALNQKVELTVKDPLLRARIEEATLDEKGIPRLADDLLAAIPPRPIGVEAPAESAENTPEEPADAPESSDADAPAQAQLG